MRLTISNALSTYSPAAFLELVRSYYKVTVSTTQSKVVPRVNINKTKTGYTIKFQGAKEVTEAELLNLSVEYAIELPELVKIFQKRKVTMRSESGEQIYEPIKRRAKKAKENAECQEA